MRIKHLFLSLCLLGVSTFVFSEDKLTPNKPENFKNNSFVVNSEEKKLVESFKFNETEQIRQHKLNIKEKKRLLKEQEDQLLKEVVLAKQQGTLTTEQKDAFKAKHLMIKAEAEKLAQINMDFMNKIHEQRKKFYNDIKNH